ncbi:uncharacterized protein PRCAT00005079001 [Priceomyces carsonii]|uniref:uncharacterized protein n=1 Tax=Priceomyces carsonii TaxID=28549 RepID=UPI002ED8FD9C|nr:unnamed protein product [Priceomyces carsonii]
MYQLHLRWQNGRVTIMIDLKINRDDSGLVFGENKRSVDSATRSSNKMRFNFASCAVSYLFVATAKGLSSESYNSDQASSTFGESSRATIQDSWTWGVEQVPNIINSSAIDANVAAKGYDLLNVSKTRHGIEGILKLKEATDIYGYDFDYLTLTVEYQTNERLNVQIKPKNMTDVFDLPDYLISKPSSEWKHEDLRGSDLKFTYQEKNFGFKVVRKATNEILFSTIGNPLVFSNQFIQFNTTLPNQHVITGLGESIHGLVNEPGAVKTLYANDVGDPIDGNIYGVHPFYLDQRYGSNTTHGVYWRTSAIQEIVLGEEFLTWRALSGVIDLYFFSGPEPKDVIQQYVKEVGLPALQPYWALGYHQCRWGYRTLEQLEEVVENFKNFNLPLETIWSDIDYMDSYKDFTNDPYRYPLDKYKAFIDKIHKNNQHYVPIVDAAIYVPNPLNESDKDYLPYSEGKGNFLKNPDGSEYIGAVWPGFTVFPDFLAPGAQEYWTKQFKRWYKDVKYDGIWCDMNEVSSFCVGSCGSGKVDQNPAQPNFPYDFSSSDYPLGYENTNSSDISLSLSSESSSPSTSSISPTTSSSQINSMNTKLPGKGNINYPPYAINNDQGNHDLATHDVSPNATHFDGTLEYDVHSLWGLTEVNATYRALLEVNENKRPFIVSRSTAPGSGKYAAHWGGDNTANWAWMYFSIPQALSMGMFGIPFFGVDACGFSGNTDYELCSRWMQLASFFPFYRNHNILGAIPQEPYLWSSVLDATKTSVTIRYSLLPYYYTLLHEAQKTGFPVMRALSWQFPHDRTLSTVDNQFFVGDALIVTPVLEPGVDKVKGTFPGASVSEVYYDWYTYEEANFTAGKNESINAPLGHIPFHIRGGNVIPTQEPAYTTTESRKNPFSLIVALDIEGKAKGSVYIDDGESQVVKSSLYVEFSAANGSLHSVGHGDYKSKQSLSNITVLGVAKRPSKVTFQNKKVNFTYENKTLIVNDLEEFTTTGAFAKAFTFSW